MSKCPRTGLELNEDQTVACKFWKERGKCDICYEIWMKTSEEG